MYQRILRDPLLFPPDMSPDAKSIMTGLLQRDPSKRLGHNGADEIKRHPFFARYIDWNKLLAKKIQPPFKPSVVRIAPLLFFSSLFPLPLRFRLIGCSWSMFAFSLGIRP